MRLVADKGAMTMRPGHPLLRKVVIEHIREGLAIVAHDLRVAIDELVDTVHEVIAAPLLKRLQQTGDQLAP